MNGNSHRNTRGYEAMEMNKSGTGGEREERW